MIQSHDVCAFRDMKVTGLEELSFSCSQMIIITTSD
uniref:Uncharacterized protein n=1 Tax=Arundo donax TaxID=35708 RepID=A0A0A9HLT1_ARUDO